MGAIGTNVSGSLPGGMPKIFVFLWFFVFNFLVLLVLLNILVAVILDHYSSVADRVKGLIDAPSIWVQFRRYLRYRRDHRGLVPMVRIQSYLQSNVFPCDQDVH